MSNGVPSFQVTLTVGYVDPHLIEVEARVAVANWSGVASAYTTPASLLQFANELRGFCNSLREEVNWEAGAGNGIGLIGLRLYPIDRAGHLACQVQLATPAASQNRLEEIWRLAVEMRTEPALVLRFAGQLSRMAETASGEAVLVGVSL